MSNATLALDMVFRAAQGKDMGPER